jgi:hypothetical protein
MYDERQQNELRAITLYTRQCSVPLIEESESDFDLLGTATPFSVNSRQYLITAAHVLEDSITSNQLGRISVRLGESSPAVSNFGKCYIETFKSSTPFDAAIIKLEHQN